MTTTLEIIDLLWSRLNTSSLKDEITGSIYKIKRLAGSSDEDIVINCLPVNGSQLQEAVANVNIHVPNITVSVEDVQDDKQPDFQRLKELAEMAIAILKENWIDTLNYSVQQQNIFEDKDYGDHYINIRLEFFIENI